jgi:DNA topoisomerase-1
MKLVIVESPTKAKTITPFLGDGFKVESSYGHVRDLPKSKLGIDIENNFEPHYIVPVKAKKRVNYLKKISKESEEIILATDSDREGEAIAWHLSYLLGLEEKTKRIVFHEITESALKKALSDPRSIDLNMVNSQQARRILDRLVGYELSPFLWKKVLRGLSAGRVQSVALRLIVEREEEIRNFKSEAYWSIEALFTKNNKTFKALLAKINNSPLPKPGIKEENKVKEILAYLQNANFEVTDFSQSEYRKNPPPPFITSTLQQESSRKLYLSAKQTMFIAQNLYEKGLITYMRTDSFNLSKESVSAARIFIKENFGGKYLFPEERIFKNKSKLAQEAHEAIRPTNVFLLPKKENFSDEKELKLYEIIWKRFLATQMQPALFNTENIELNYNGYIFRASGLKLKFDGFLKVLPQEVNEKELPQVKKGEILKADKIYEVKHFTEPEPRYNEATLIKALESYGIGRPSTYASILSVIQERNYVIKNKDKRFEPSEIGELVNKVLVNNFPEIVDVKFTAKMEEDLDKIAVGEKEWRAVVRDFYIPFSKHLKERYALQSEEKMEKETDEKCEKCGKNMVVKFGRFGKFLACSGFPDCKNTKPYVSEELGKCPKCGKGFVVQKKTKNRRVFYGCSEYPNCDWAAWKKPNGEVKTN